MLLVLVVMPVVFAKSKRKPPKYFFKIASEAPDGSSWVIAMKRINKILMNKTRGEVGIRVYPGSIMGDQSSVIKKMQLKQLSGATFSGNGLSQIYKDFNVMGFPMMVQTYDEYDYLIEKISPYFEGVYRKRGYEMVAWTEVGFIYCYSQTKVNSLAALKQAKPFLMEGDIVTRELFREADVKYTQLQIADVITSLQTGMVDTVFSSPYALIALQWFTKVKYHADLPIAYMTGAILLDRDLFASMPKEYQKLVRETFKSEFDKMKAQGRLDNEKASQSLKKAGIISLDVSGVEKDRFYDLRDSVKTRLTKEEYSRDLLKKIEGIIADYNKK
jgi:TRAP-type C4-dicarboxylate transport system substrate-binding protein